MNMPLSYSRIKSYGECPHLFKLKYIDKIELQRQPPLVIGGIAHNAIANYNNLCLKNAKKSMFEKWEDCTRDALREEPLPPEYEQDVFDILKAYVERGELDLESIVGFEEPMSIDAKFNEVDWKAEDVWFRGIIDKLQVSNNSAKITDYKTGYGMTADKFQLEIYAWLLSKIYPQLTRFEIELDYVRFDYQDTYEILADELPAIEAKIFNRVKQIYADKEFKPTPCNLCEYCGAWKNCPAMDKESLITLPNSPQEAKLVAEGYLTAQKKAKECSKALKAYCDLTGDFLACGQKWSYKASRNWKVDISELLLKLNGIGVNLLPYLQLDTKKFGKIAEREDVLAVLKEIGERKVSVRFSDSKEKVDK